MIASRSITSGVGVLLAAAVSWWSWWSVRLVLSPVGVAAEGDRVTEEDGGVPSVWAMSR